MPEVYVCVGFYVLWRLITLTWLPAVEVWQLLPSRITGTNFGETSWMIKYSYINILESRFTVIKYYLKWDWDLKWEYEGWSDGMRSEVEFEVGAWGMTWWHEKWGGIWSGSMKDEVMAWGVRWNLKWEHEGWSDGMRSEVGFEVGVWGMKWWHEKWGGVWSGSMRDDLMAWEVRWNLKWSHERWSQWRNYRPRNAGGPWRDGGPKFQN